MPKKFRFHRSFLSIFLIFIALFTLLYSQDEPSPELPGAERYRPVLVLTVAEAIGPASADYIRQGLAEAARINAALLVLKLDTPGGLDTAMRDIIQAILNSDIPVATYVSPSGARAASAGTYILMASHIAAMSPGTNLGAATPVNLFSGGDEEKAGTANVTDNAMRHKVINDATAYIRGLARMRGRNEEWAAEAVTKAASIPAEEALRRKVIDMIAPSVDILADALDGRTVTVNDKTETLRTANGLLVEFEKSWRLRLLSILTSPEVAYILLLIGIYGLFFEFANPGFIAPGVIGGISLILALYSFNMLPVNFAGVLFILLGIALLVAEAFVPSFGILGIGGTAAFALGSVMLIDSPLLGFGISLPVIITFTIINSLFILVVITMAVRSHRRPVVTGKEGLIGSTAEALESFTKRGMVRCQGELWRARTEAPVTKGDILKVTKVDGLTLIVTGNDSPK